MYFVKKFLAVIFLHTNFVVGSLYKGDACLLKNGGNGICKMLTKCPEAISALRTKTFPQQCGFEGFEVIVCCGQTIKPSSEHSEVKSQTPGETTIKPSSKLTQAKSRTPGVISNEKCVEYSDYMDRSVPAVAGGKPASTKEFPHMVQFGYEANDGVKWTCGGSLISDQFVLTAAHCLSDRSLGDARYARMGIIDLEDDNHLQLINVAERIPFPNYKEPSYYHDIGLVKLNQKVILDSWVLPACLYTNSSLPQTEVIASGWGKTEFAGQESRILLKVILELYDQSQCNKIYRQEAGSTRLMEGIRDDIMICAGHSKELRDTCQGDSGGPLHVYKYLKNESPLRPYMYDVVGVTSFGKACALAVNVPAVYTRVSYYIKWIEDIIWPPTV